MIFQLGRADRWVYGHWNPASQQNAEEGFEIFPAGGQHDRDGLGGFQALADQARRQRLRTCLQVCISYAARRFGIGLVQLNVGAFGLVLRAPGQHAEQCIEVCGHRVGRSQLCLIELDRYGRLAIYRARRQHRLEQIPRRFSRAEHLLW